MPRGTVEIIVTARFQEVYRESDGHLMILVETFANGALFGLAVADPRDYEVD